MKFRVYRVTENGVRYAYSKHMWGSSSEGALLFDKENEAYQWATDNDIEDFSIENDKPKDDKPANFEDIYQ